MTIRIEACMEIQFLRHQKLKSTQTFVNFASVFLTYVSQKFGKNKNFPNTTEQNKFRYTVDLQPNITIQMYRRYEPFFFFPQKSKNLFHFQASQVSCFFVDLARCTQNLVPYDTSIVNSPALRVPYARPKYAKRWSSDPDACCGGLWLNFRNERITALSRPWGKQCAENFAAGMRYASNIWRQDFRIS